MDENEIRSFFIKHLADSDNPNDLIMEVCDQTNRPWPEVEAILKDVQSTNADEITRRKAPLLTIIALGIFMIGVGIALYSFYTLITLMGAISKITFSPLDLYDAFQMLGAVAYQYGLGVIIGILMAVGSLTGMRDVWSSILNKGMETHESR